MPTVTSNRLPLTLLALCASCAVLGAAPALAASGDRIGDAVAITNTVMADFAKDRRRLAAGDDVRQDEVIEVSADAQGELKLDDDTKLALGAGSRLVLDKFVYDSDKKTGSIILNLAKGTFRFITGIAAKPAYVINTPNASITVRGTIFDVFILDDQSTWLLLHEGAFEVTAARSICQVLDQPGRLIWISSTGTVGRPVDWSNLPGNQDVPFDTAFPFVTNAPQIDPTPVLTRTAIIDGAQEDQPVKACVNPAPPVKVQKADSGPGQGGWRSKAPRPAKVKQARKQDVPAPPKPTKYVKMKEPRTKTAKQYPKDSKIGPAIGIAIGIGIGIAAGKLKRRGGGYGRGDYSD